MSHSLSGLWPLALYAVLVVCGIAGIILVSHFLGPRYRTHPNPATEEPFESGITPVGSGWQRFPAHFYLIAAFFVVFDMEAAFIFAWAVAFREVGWTGYIEIAIFIAVLLAALAYLWRVGGLEWRTARSAGRRNEAMR